MTKLYAVVTDSGYDEGTTIHGIYTTPELAAEAMRRYGADRIEEQQADVLPELPHGLYAWQVQLWQGVWKPTTVNVESVDTSRSWCDEDSGTIYVRAKNPTDAMEVAMAEVPRLREEARKQAIRQAAKRQEDIIAGRVLQVTWQDIVNDAMGFTVH